MRSHLREGAEKYFRIAVTPEMRPVGVCPTAAIDGKAPPVKSESEAAGGGRVASSLAFATRWPPLGLPRAVASSRHAFEEALGRAMDHREFRDAPAAESTTATASNCSMEEFRRALEDGRRRPVLEETKLTGVYDFRIQGAAQGTEPFVGMLRDELSLVLTPPQPSMEITVPRPVE